MICVCVSVRWTDSPAFDARSYYEQLISTSMLSALLKRENQLQAGQSFSIVVTPACSFLRRKWIGCTEIRQLDNDRQSLVYNHHHELIAASDTISAVCHCLLLYEIVTIG